MSTQYTVHVTAHLKHDYADLGEVKLHYAHAGEGPLIVFLHGFPEFWYMWRNQLQEFSSTHHAVAPDLRGYNLSSKPVGVENYLMAHVVDDVRALIFSLGKKKAVVVGHDWGGVTAWALALRYPELVEKLVIINAPHPQIFRRELAANPEQRKASEYVPFLQRAETEEEFLKTDFHWLKEATLSRGLRKGFLTPDDVSKYVEAWSRPGALAGMLNYYRANLDLKSVGKKGPVSITEKDRSDFTVKPPTLVIWGEADRAILLGNLEGLEEWVPKLTVRRLPDTSHWVLQERSLAVNQAIRAFL